MHFYRTMQLCYHGLGSRNFVCLSAHLSHVCFVTKPNNAQWIFFIPQVRAITLVFWHQQWSVGDAPFRLKFVLSMTHPSEKRQLWQIFAYNVSAVRNSEKSSIMMNWKSTKGFPNRYRLECGSESDFLFSVLIKFSFSRIKSAIKFRCVKTSSSNNITIPPSNGP